MRFSVVSYLLGIILIMVLIIPCVADSGNSQVSYIVVGQGPVAQFSAAYAYPVVPTQVIFKDYSQGSTPMSYLWTFGDGQSSTDQNPTHIYTKQGLYTVSLTVTNAYGTNTAVKNNYIAIGVSPAADFVATPTSGTAPQNVQFTDLSSGGVTSWLWNFGDGQTSTDQNPVHTYYAGGTYTVILTVTNGFGSSDATKNQYIVIAGQLQSKFSANPTEGPTPLTVTFTDKSLGAPTTWNWDFGDGSTSTVQYPTHTFTVPGVYTVKLTVSLGSMSDTSSQVVDAGGVPIADFVGNPVQVNVMGPVQFTDKSSNSPTSWKWDFGDTATSTDQNPTHSYQLNGLYTVTLTAANSNGQNAITKVGYINVGLAPLAAFRPVINPSQISSIPMMVSFVDQSANSPTSWSWDFGDGSTSTDQNPSHLYGKAGTYTVTLTATNQFGSNTVVKSNLIDVGNNIAVDFSADQTTVGVGQLVMFTDHSTNSPTNWEWEFGDGTIASGSPNPDHVYTAVGVYDVTLTASNPTMTNSLTKHEYITVLNLPRANFVASPTRGGAPLTVSFTDMSTGSLTQWLWNFGDGSTSTAQNPTHTYSQLGTYTVMLTVTNQNGSDTATKSDYIVVTLAPVADFTVDQRIGNAPFIVQFRDLSTNNPTSWLWQFGDSTTSTQQNPRHVYPNIGAYNVTLTVTNQYGSDTSYKAGNATTLTSIQTIATTSPPTQVPTAIVTTIVPVTTATQSPITAGIPILAIVMAGLIFAGLYRRK
jgi:PKD repeat protein